MPVDLQICFVVDYHGFMTQIMVIIKNYIELIINKVKKQYPTKSIEVAFVGYGGYFVVPYRKVCKFAQDIQKLQKELLSFEVEHQFTSSCRNIQDAYGSVNDLQWNGKHRVIFHLGDGPPFGPAYHTPDIPDLYPRGHPYLIFEEEVKKISMKNIDLVLLKLNNNWDVMIGIIHNICRYRKVYVEDLTDKYLILCDATHEVIHKHILRQLM